MLGRSALDPGRSPLNALRRDPLIDLSMFLGGSHLEIAKEATLSAHGVLGRPVDLHSTERSLSSLELSSLSVFSRGRSDWTGTLPSRRHCMCVSAFPYNALSYRLLLGIRISGRPFLPELLAVYSSSQPRTHQESPAQLPVQAVCFRWGWRQTMFQHDGDILPDVVGYGLIGKVVFTNIGEWFGQERHGSEVSIDHYL